MAMKITALTIVNSWYLPAPIGAASARMRAHSGSV
jgi:hypothetical protein